MANKNNKKNNVSKVKIDKDKAKWGNISYYILIGLIISIPFCLICGWISGDTKLTAISDNFVTALIQNYNYILGMFVLIPVIAYIFSIIKKELDKKMISDSITVLRWIYCYNYCNSCYYHSMYICLSNKYFYTLWRKFSCNGILLFMYCSYCYTRIDSLFNFKDN